MKATKFLSVVMLTVMVAFAACNEGPEVPEGPGTTDPPTPTDTTTVVDTTQVSDYLTVTQAIAKQDNSEATVKGYIVGWYNVKPNPGVCVFSAEAAVDTTVNKANVLIADAASETDAGKIVCVQLPAGAVRSLVNLGENPGNLGLLVVVKGNLTNYNSLPGVKTTNYAEINGKKSTDPQAELLCYRTKLGSIDDGVVSSLKAGDIVVIKSVLINFKGTYETRYGYFTSINGNVPTDAINATQALVLAKTLQETTDPKNPYASDSILVTGTVTQITDAYSTQYKNITFKIKD